MQSSVIPQSAASTVDGVCYVPRFELVTVSHHDAHCVVLR